MTIFKKFDYYSAMLHGTTLRKILTKFGFDPSVIDAGDDGLGLIDLFSGAKNTATGGGVKILFVLPQVKIYVPYNSCGFTGGLDVSADSLHPVDDDFDVDMSLMILDTEIQGVRIEMAGGELDSFRLLGYCPEKDFCDPEYWIGGENPVATEWKLTRVDFAFDFLDLPAPYTELARDLCVFINSTLATFPQGKRFTTDDNRPSGLKCHTAFGADKTVGYIGAASSGKARFLRVYDKLQERCGRLGCDQSLWPEFMAEEYRTCCSWVRFELEARYEFAEDLLYKRDLASDKYLFGEDLLDEVWKFIAKHFCICSEKNKPYALLRSFYDMITDQIAVDAAERHRIDEKCKFYATQGTAFTGLDPRYKCTPVELGIKEKLERWKYRNLRWILLWVGLQGKQGILNDANELLDYLIDSDGFSVQRRKSQLFSDLTTASLLTGKHYSNWPGFGLTLSNRLICSFDRLDELPDAGSEIDVATLYEVGSDLDLSEYSEFGEQQSLKI